MLVGDSIVVSEHGRSQVRGGGQPPPVSISKCVVAGNRAGVERSSSQRFLSCLWYWVIQTRSEETFLLLAVRCCRDLLPSLIYKLNNIRFPLPDFPAKILATPKLVGLRSILVWNGILIIIAMQSVTLLITL